MNMHTYLVIGHGIKNGIETIYTKTGNKKVCLIFRNQVPLISQNTHAFKSQVRTGTSGIGLAKRFRRTAQVTVLFQTTK